jgi:Kef-type K+ transport system membrane component KefB
LLQEPPAGQDAMKLSSESAALLLLIAAVVAMLTRRLRLPYSAGLVAAGMGLALLQPCNCLRMPAAISFQESRMSGNLLVRFDEGRVGRTARCRPLSYSTG